MSKRSSDEFDNDRTDELPVLLETVFADEGGRPLAATHHLEDTGEHTALYRGGEPSPGASELQAPRPERATQLAGLQAQFTALAARAHDLEQRLHQKEQVVAELKQTVATLRQTSQDASAAERRLATQLAVRDARIAELTATVERAQGESVARATDIGALRTAAEAARREAETLRGELAARVAENTPPDVQKLLEENAALTTYIAGRRAWWDQVQADQAGLAAKITTLENALANGAKRLVDAEAFATRESNRAISFRADLVDYARQVAALESELRAARATAVPVPPQASAGAKSTERSAIAPAAPKNTTGQELPASDPPVAPVAPIASAAPDTGAAPPAAEALSQLEAEVEYKRQQVTAQLVELRERDQRLHAATSETDQLRRDLAALRNELDESRSTAARLERAVIDKDRALEARDARIVTLHDELKLRLGAIEQLNSMASKLSAPAAQRTTSTDAAADNPSAPALLCLTGEAPKRFTLTKKTVTVGRGPQCDLQILTHFVSREHARITMSGGSVLVEDLGSRNGVFVNAVRVERQILQQGDLLTVGETQFRFMESMEH